MSIENADIIRESLRAWLRAERQLGLTHYTGAPSAGISAPPTAHARVSATVAHDPPPVSAMTPPPAARPVAPSAPPAPRPAAPQTLPLTSGDAALPPFCREALPPEKAVALLTELDEKYVKGCRKCRLCEQRTQTVFGVGASRAELAFVGEGPGADEDAQGQPFVGRAGQLLTRMIAAMKLTREQVYICNVVKCRPPGNRTPTDDEMAACSPYLWRQLAIVRPRIIVTLGRPATQTLLGSKDAMSRLRGRFYAFPPPHLENAGFADARIMPTFHPAFLLRNPDAKKDVWEDLQQVMSELGLS